MADNIQLPGGTSENEDYYVGPDRSVRVDVSNWELRLHDGSTPGGFRIPNRNTNDQRYQARSTELDGFDFAPQLTGFLTRVAPGSYRMRQLTVNGNQLEITNPRGLLGDPLIGLKGTISTPHTWSGTQTFSQAIVASGGVTGNVTGNLVGNVTGNVVGNLTGNVTGNLTGNSTGTHTGNVDVSAHTLTLAPGQIPGEALADEILAFLVPLGTILMWSGDESDLPPTWHLCDGGNGTPDLRDRFIVAAGTTTAPHATGGAASHTHTATTANAGLHQHDLSITNHVLVEAEIPAHKHAAGVGDGTTSSELFVYGETACSTNKSIDDLNDDGVVQPWTSTVGGGGGHTHEDSTSDEIGTHAHTVTVDSTNNVPPYYALCFIMKGAFV